jgi:hypothetical protein
LTIPTFNWAEAVAGDKTAAAQARGRQEADRNADLTMDTRLYQVILAAPPKPLRRRSTSTFP